MGLQATLNIQKQQQQQQRHMRPTSAAATESSEELTGISFVQARVETETNEPPRRQTNSMQDNKFMSHRPLPPSPTTTFNASHAAVANNPPNEVSSMRGRVSGPSATDEHVGFADESMCVDVSNNNNSNLQSKSKLKPSSVDLLREVCILVV